MTQSWIFVSVVSQLNCRRIFPYVARFTLPGPTKDFQVHCQGLGCFGGGVSFCYPNKLHWALQENMDVIGFNSVKFASMHKTKRWFERCPRNILHLPEGKIHSNKHLFEMGGGGQKIWTIESLEWHILSGCESSDDIAVSFSNIEVCCLAARKTNKNNDRMPLSFWMLGSSNWASFRPRAFVIGDFLAQILACCFWGETC